MLVNLKSDNIFEQNCKEMLTVLKEDGLPIIICGNVDEDMYVSFFEKNAVIPENVYDRSPKLHGKKCRFGNIINIQDIERLYTDFNAVVVVPYFDEIKKALEEVSSHLHHIFFLDIAMLHCHPTMFLSGGAQVIAENIHKFENLYECFEDDESRQTWTDLLNYWISGDHKILEKYKGKQSVQYLDFFDLTEEEVFVHCGAFDGRYSKKFMDLVNDKYRKVINIECDEENYNSVCANMEGYSGIRNVKIGLHNKKGVLCFHALGNGMSCLDPLGKYKVDVDSMDNILKGEEPTFIKMDIEGAEYCALEGAERTIKKYLPKMAICIYHNIKDFIEIPALIKRFDNRYKFAVRHYTDTLTETVLFAWVDN